MPTLTTAALAAHATERLAALLGATQRHVAAAWADGRQAVGAARCVDALAQQLERIRELASLAKTFGDDAACARITTEICNAELELISAAYQCRMRAVHTGAEVSA